MSIFETFKHPTVRKYNNCVSFAIGNPFAFLFCRAYDSNVVIPRLKKTPAVKYGKPMGDLYVWYGDLERDCEEDERISGYHMGIIVNKHIVEMCGHGGLIKHFRLKDAIEWRKDKYKYSKRIKKFNLPYVDDPLKNEGTKSAKFIMEFYHTGTIKSKTKHYNNNGIVLRKNGVFNGLPPEFKDKNKFITNWFDEFDAMYKGTESFIPYEKSLERKGYILEQYPEEKVA